jgi:pimeloyl-ACP methyl ester carboxylesterase
MSPANERSFTTPDGTRLALCRQGPCRQGPCRASTLRAGLDAPLTIVLVHGWVVDSRIWGPVADMLSSGPRGRPVLRYDRRAGWR